MIRLIGVELTRITRRGATTVLAALLLLITVGIAVGLFLQLSPPSQAETASARAAYEQELQSWKENSAELYDACLAEGPGAEFEEMYGITSDCEVAGPPELEWFLPSYVSPYEESARNVLQGQAGTLGAVMLLLGATFLAADFASGSLGTWLTFVPRRGRVIGAKFIAAGATAGVLSAVTLTLTAACVWLVHRVRGLDTVLPPGAGSDLLWMGLRAAVLAMAAAIAGVALAAVVRNTAGALAIGLGYLLIVESTITSLLPDLARWAVTTNAAGFVQGRYDIWQEVCSGDPQVGRSCSFEPIPLDPAQFPIVLGVVLAVVVGAGVLAFRRRDVA